MPPVFRNNSPEVALRPETIPPEILELLVALRDVASRVIEHVDAGGCPDNLACGPYPTSRAEACPACDVLRKVDVLLAGQPTRTTRTIEAADLWALHREFLGGKSGVSGDPLPELLDERPVPVQGAHYGLALVVAKLLGTPEPTIPPALSASEATRIVDVVDNHIRALFDSEPSTRRT